MPSRVQRQIAFLERLGVPSAREVIIPHEVLDWKALCIDDFYDRSDGVLVNRPHSYKIADLVLR